MDERWGFPLLLTPIAIFVVGYALAWRGRNARLRKAGSGVIAAVCGLVALFASWWALGMTDGVWFSPETDRTHLTFGGVLLGLALEAFILFFPTGLWYLCIRFVRITLRRDD
jgi:hypothetical protein